MLAYAHIILLIRFQGFAADGNEAALMATDSIYTHTLDRTEVFVDPRVCECDERRRATCCISRPDAVARQGALRLSTTR